MPSLNPDDPPRPLAGVGPILFAFSVVGAVWIWTSYRGRRLPPRAPSHSAAALPDHAGVDGWAGTLGSLHARLMPLHADPARQRFDGRVLAERLGLDAGEPWRLVVTYLTRGAEDQEPVSLRDWKVVDAEGVALRPIVAVGAEGNDLDLDPLRSLLSVPPAILPGHEVSVVLWGRPPSGSKGTADRVGSEDPDDLGHSGNSAPSIVGLPALGAGAHAGTGTLRLAARRFDDFTAQPSLARLEPDHGPGTGSPVGPASQPSVR